MLQAVFAVASVGSTRSRRGRAGGIDAAKEETRSGLNPAAIPGPLGTVSHDTPERNQKRDRPERRARTTSEREERERELETLKRKIRKSEA
jgi:hypothetical protein